MAQQITWDNLMRTVDQLQDERNEALAENKRLRDGIERLLAMPDIVPAGTRNYLNGLLDAR